MVKISYDSDNKEDCEIIDDYYFLKYYSKSIVSDWKKFYDENINFKDENEILQIIYNHLNKTEYERLDKAFQKFFFFFGTRKYQIIKFILNDRKEFINRCKHSLIVQYGDFEN